MKHLVAFAFAATLIHPALAQEPELGWIVDAANGCRIFYFPLERGETVSWDGACSGGIAQGPGNLMWAVDGAPGDEFHGELRDGKITGYGKLFFRQGGSYEGDFAESVMNGRGLAWDARGGRYDGEWRNGEWNGSGDYMDRYGSRWAGEFRDGKLNGYGISSNPSGALYEGEFVDEKAHGRGTLKTPVGEIHAGIWQDGCLKEGAETFIVGVAPEACEGK